MGRCYLDLLDTNQGRLLPSLTGLIEAVQALHDRQKKGIDVFNPLNECDLMTAWPLPLPLLHKTLGEEIDFYVGIGGLTPVAGRGVVSPLPAGSPGLRKKSHGKATKASTAQRAGRGIRKGGHPPKLDSEREQFLNTYFEQSRADEHTPGKNVAYFDFDNPLLALMWMVPKLDRRIYAAIEHEPDDPFEVVFHRTQPYVILDGEIHPITRRQGLVLEGVISGCGAIISGNEIKTSNPELEAANISREVSTLPEPLKRFVKSHHPKGFSWVESPGITSSIPASSAAPR